MKIEDKEFFDFELDGINFADYPDFCDAFIINASVVDGSEPRKATDSELELLNDDSSLVYELVMEQIF
jgi:hypothetical protein